MELVLLTHESDVPREHHSGSSVGQKNKFNLHIIMAKKKKVAKKKAKKVSRRRR